MYDVPSNICQAVPRGVCARWSTGGAPRPPATEGAGAWGARALPGARVGLGLHYLFPFQLILTCRCPPYNPNTP